MISAFRGLGCWGGSLIGGAMGAGAYENAGEGQARVFISYSRKDLEFVRTLRDDLKAEGISVWHDLQDIGAGQWWSQIERELVGQDSVKHVVLVLTPDSVKSKNVADEWRFARRDGKSVLPITPAGDLPEQLRPWIRAQHIYNYSVPEQRAKLLSDLHRPSELVARPITAPPLPRSFIPRIDLHLELKAALISQEGDGNPVSLALRGSGGFGKSALATALVRDEETQNAFFDGIVWLTLGEKPNIITKLSEAINQLSRERPRGSDANSLASYFWELLEKRHCLLVIDDVWREEHLRYFLGEAPNVACLVTTRKSDILPADVPHVVVDTMTEDEARHLLGADFTSIDKRDRAQLATLATDRLGRWPILLGLVNRFLHTRVSQGEALTDAIARVTERLDREGLSSFDRFNETERSAAIERTIKVGLDFLAEFDKSARPPGFHTHRYSELTVFPDDIEVPIATVARLWGQTASVSGSESEQLLERMYSLALLQVLDLKSRKMRLHDIMKEYLADTIGPSAIASLHKHAADAYGAIDRDQIMDRDEREYYFSFYLQHLQEASQCPAIDDILFDAGWMHDKLIELGDPIPVVSDYETHANSSEEVAIGRAVQLAAPILRRQPEQFFVQMVGRLNVEDGRRVSEFRRVCEQGIARGAIRTLTPSLTSSNAEVARLEGHPSRITALASISPELLVSGAEDGSLITWDLKRMRLLEFNALPRRYAPMALCRIDQDTLAIGTFGGPLVICDTPGFKNTRTLETRPYDSLSVSGIVLLPDGKLASASHAMCSLLWDMESGECIQVLENFHTSEINCLIRLQDGRIATGAAQGTIAVWDHTGATEPVTVRFQTVETL